MSARASHQHGGRGVKIESCASKMKKQRCKKMNAALLRQMERADGRVEMERIRERYVQVFWKVWTCMSTKGNDCLKLYVTEVFFFWKIFVTWGGGGGGRWNEEKEADTWKKRTEFLFSLIYFVHLNVHSRWFLNVFRGLFLLCLLLLHNKITIQLNKKNLLDHYCSLKKKVVLSDFKKHPFFYFPEVGFRPR